VAAAATPNRGGHHPR